MKMFAQGIRNILMASLVPKRVILKSKNENKYILI